MKWFRKLFGLVDSPEIEGKVEAKGKYSGCDIMYLPLSGRYYPRYCKQFIFRFNAGYYTLYDDPGCCEYGETEEEAKKKLDVYLESRGVNTKIIKIE